MPHTLPKTERLRGERRISHLFDNGESGFVYPYRYVFMAEQSPVEQKEVAVLVSVSKRYHKRANKRNLIKRRTREAYRLNNDSLKELPSLEGRSFRLALVYSSKEVTEYKTVENAVKKILSAICERI